MGYYSFLTGSINNVSKEQWEALKDKAPDAGHDDDKTIENYFDFEYHTVSRSMVVNGESKKYYEIEEMLDFLCQFLPQEAEGLLEEEGEENLDVSRYYIKGNRWAQVTPEIVWPKNPLDKED